MIKPNIFHILVWLAFANTSYGMDDPENKSTRSLRSGKKVGDRAVRDTHLLQVQKEAQAKKDEEARKALKFVEEDLLSLAKNPSEETPESSAEQ